MTSTTYQVIWMWRYITAATWHHCKDLKTSYTTSINSEQSLMSQITFFSFIMASDACTNLDKYCANRREVKHHIYTYHSSTEFFPKELFSPTHYKNRQNPTRQLVDMNSDSIHRLKFEWTKSKQNNALTHNLNFIIKSSNINGMVIELKVTLVGDSHTYLFYLEELPLRCAEHETQ